MMALPDWIAGFLDSISSLKLTEIDHNKFLVQVTRHVILVWHVQITLCITVLIIRGAGMAQCAKVFDQQPISHWFESWHL